MIKIGIIKVSVLGNRRQKKRRNDSFAFMCWGNFCPHNVWTSFLWYMSWYFLNKQTPIIHTIRLDQRPYRWLLFPISWLLMAWSAFKWLHCAYCMKTDSIWKSFSFILNLFYSIRAWFISTCLDINKFAQKE